MRRLGEVALLVLALALPARADFPQYELGGNMGAKRSINFVVFAEGWKADEMGDFQAAAKKVVEGLFQIKPYDAYRNYVRVVGIGTPSTDHGCKRTGEPPIERKGKIDRSKEYLTKDTYFQVVIPPETQGARKWDNFAGVIFPAEGQKKLKDLIDDIPCDYAILLTPDEDLKDNARALRNINKGDDYPVPTVIMNSGGSVGITAAHELGHSMFELGDEYPNGSNCAGFEILPYRNLSRYDDARVPWAHLLPCLGKPIPGGACPGALKATPTCIMNVETMGEGARFCDACLSAMTGKVGEKASLIRRVEPGGPVVFGTPSGSWIFKVDTRGTSDSDYTGEWFVDGKSIGAGSRSPSPDGPKFDIGFSVKVGIIDSGVHKVQFTVVNNQEATNQKCAKHVGKTPHTRTWRIVASPFKFNIPGLAPKESWE